MTTAELITAAAQKLIDTLVTMGFPADTVELRLAEAGQDEVVVKFNPPGLVKDAEIDVYVSLMWDNPDVAYYFVNCHKPGQNFICNEGTPSLEQVLFKLGEGVHFCSR